MVDADQINAGARRFGRRRDRVRRARRAAGLGRTGVRPLEADLAKAMLSLPATKGFEIGLGLCNAARLTGAEHNDPFEMRAGAVRTTTNHSGGVQGGISNGEDIVFRVAFKPTATITRAQKTVTVSGEEHRTRCTRPPRSVRAAARRADGRGDGGAGAGGPRVAPAGDGDLTE